MKKLLKVLFICSLIFFALAFAGGTWLLVSTYSEYNEIKFNADTINSSALTIEIYDNENKQIKEYNHFTTKFVSLKELPKHVPDAFISIEDKTFYSHGGINYKRMAKAGFENLKSWDLKQGASTISQQLIKNTHLSGEKTFSRKVKEILLTQRLEREYSKEEILERYLNIIYFGNNCYGIEAAANYYFSKPASELTVAEGATLAGMIKSPRNFSPLTAKERCLTRRNLVISELEKDTKIDPTTAKTAKNSDITLHLNTERDNKLNSYSEASLDEATKILKLPAKQIAIGGYKIYTYQDPQKQEALNTQLSKARFDNNDYAGIIIDPHTNAVTAYVGNSDYKILEAKRQPGSTIKPILVYAPAVNENIISPATQILDEKIDIGGYKPNNVNGTFAGYMSAREALAKSVNIPAIKILSYVGIDRAKTYAERTGIPFEPSDNGYGIALGGMAKGVNLLTLTNSYTPLVKGGNYAPASFVSYIQNSSGKIVYRHKPVETPVLRADTAYLVTDMLKTSAKIGTAKKLSDLPFEVASKTGTVGKPGSKENLDAYNISYTTSDVIGVWVGNMDNRGITISGGNSPTLAVKDIMQKIYKTKPKPFEIPNGIQEVEIDLIELSKNHHVVKASGLTDEKDRKKELFSSFCLPKEPKTTIIQKTDDEPKPIEPPKVTNEIKEQRKTKWYL